MRTIYDRTSARSCYSLRVSITEFGENTARRSSASDDGRTYSKPEVVSSTHPSGGEECPSATL
jgi:hypothetical protein